MATVDGLGGSYVYVAKEVSYNSLAGNHVDISEFKIPIRVGSIPAQSQQRVHARHLGKLDTSPSLVGKNSVAGGYSMYITSNQTNQNKIYEMAGVDTTETAVNTIGANKSYVISETTGTDIAQWILLGLSLIHI